MEGVLVFAQEGGGNVVGTLFGLLILVALGFAGYRAFQASKEESTEEGTIKSLPPSIQHVVSRMDRESQNAFFNEYQKRKKKRSIGWIAWLLLGWHYLYVGKVGLQFAFWFTAGGFFIWWVADFFRMPSIIRSANEQIARETVQTLGVTAAFGRDSGPSADQPGQEPELPE